MYDTGLEISPARPYQEVCPLNIPVRRLQFSSICYNILLHSSIIASNSFSTILSNFVPFCAINFYSYNDFQPICLIFPS